MAEQNGNPLSGDALITFGFRRVIEEMQELRLPSDSGGSSRRCRSFAVASLS